ncbi:hypothetical protein ACJRO7_020263 [Eucalyptus globulus]|uniref:Autophagy-related protein n=1 Tax=Eucalyptus globulus TaxID=34317 RepID=A0ABD3KG01_EUCGL
MICCFLLSLEEPRSLLARQRRSTSSERIRPKSPPTGRPYTGRDRSIVQRSEDVFIPAWLRYLTCSYTDLMLKTCRYLVPADLTVGQFVYVIRKRIKLSAEKAIFIFVDNVLPPTGAIMSAIYDEKKDEDGFLYVTYSGENTFGDN